MAICKACGQEMLTAKGCKKIPIKCSDGKTYDPIKYGDPRERFQPDSPSQRCGDCGALPGHYHHVNCDMERCPKCGGQLISCGCMIDTPEDITATPKPKKEKFQKISGDILDRLIDTLRSQQKVSRYKLWNNRYNLRKIIEENLKLKKEISIIDHLCSTLTNKKG